MKLRSAFLLVLLAITMASCVRREPLSRHKTPNEICAWERAHGEACFLTAPDIIAPYQATR